MPYPIVREILIVTCTVAGAAIGLMAARSLQLGDAVTVTGAFVGWSLFGGFAHVCLTRSQRDD
jgi:hypothetical protein